MLASPSVQASPPKNSLRNRSLPRSSFLVSAPRPAQRRRGKRQHSLALGSCGPGYGPSPDPRLGLSRPRPDLSGGPPILGLSVPARFARQSNFLRATCSLNKNSQASRCPSRNTPLLRPPFRSNPRQIALPVGSSGSLIWHGSPADSLPARQSLSSLPTVTGSMFPRPAHVSICHPSAKTIMYDSCRLT